MARRDKEKLVKRLFRSNPNGRFTEREIEAAIGERSLNPYLRALVAKRYLGRERQSEGFIYYRVKKKRGGVHKLQRSTGQYCPLRSL